jgi:hypothetical protein
MPCVTISREEGTIHGTFDRGLEVRIVEHDQRVLAAHFELEFGHPSHTGAGNLAASGDGSGEGDGIDVAAVQKGLANHGSAPHHEIEDPLGQSRSRDDLGERMGRSRNQVGRLEQDGVAIAERRCNFPCRNGNGEIPRRDDADHTDRFTGDFDIDIGPNAGNLLAHQPQRLAGEEIEDLPCPRDLSDAFGTGLALLASQELAEFFLTGQNFVGDFLQRVVPLLRRRPRPGRRGSLGGGDRGVRLRRVGVGILADDIVGVGRVDIARGFCAGDPFATDEILVKFRHGLVS